MSPRAVGIHKRFGRHCDALVGAGVFLKLGDGDVEAEEGVLAGLGLALGVARNGRLDPRVNAEADEQDHEKREECDRNQQREAATWSATAASSELRFEL
jgi:hypothetical protein